jgi:hypothetical protein
MIGSPLANLLMNHFKTSVWVGVWQTFIVLGLGYFVYMIAGAFGYRVPPAGWRLEGWTPPATQRPMITANHVDLKHAHKTPQFWLIWAVLCLNVSAGIGIIGAASPIAGDIRRGAVPRSFEQVFGQRFLIRSAARRPILSSSSGILCYAVAPTLAGMKAIVVSRPHFASSPRCTAADLLPCRPTLRRAPWLLGRRAPMESAGAVSTPRRSSVGHWSEFRSPGACGRLSKRRENLSIGGRSRPRKPPWLWLRVRGGVGTAGPGRLCVKQCQILFARR